MLRLLLPLAPTLKSLDLGGNNLGGKITSDIKHFRKLSELGLYQMGLQGAFDHGIRLDATFGIIKFSSDAQAPYRRSSGACKASRSFTCKRTSWKVRSYRKTHLRDVKRYDTILSHR